MVSPFRVCTRRIAFSPPDSGGRAREDLQRLAAESRRRKAKLLTPYLTTPAMKKSKF